MNNKIHMFYLFLSFIWATESTAQWTSLTNPTNYWLYSIDVVTENTVYAGGYGGELTKTTDGGQTWTSLNPGSADWVKSIQFENADSGWIAGASSYIPDPGRIMETTDGGQTWTLLYTGGHYTEMQRVTPDVAYAGGFDAYFSKTTDRGLTWTDIALPIDSSSTIIDICFLDPLNGYVLVNGPSPQVLRTNDGGQTWATFYRSGIKDVHFQTTTMGYGIRTFGYTSYIMKTTDGGATFNDLFQIDSIQMRQVNFLDNMHGYAIGGLYCGNGTCTQKPAIYETVDGGQTWLDITPSFVIGQTIGFFQLEATPNGVPFVSGSSGTIVKGNPPVISGIPAVQASEVSLNAFPNPITNNQLTIQANTELAQVRLFDLNGIEVLNVNPQNQSTALNVETLPSGTYMLEATTATGETVPLQKVVKLPTQQ